MTLTGRTWLMSAAVLLLGAVVAVVWWDGNDEAPPGLSVAARMALADRLGRRGGGRADRRLAAMARDREPKVALAAMRNLGVSQSAANYQLLTEIATSAASPNRRAAAAAALGRYPDADPALLTDLLTGDRHSAVRAGAARGLAAWSSPHKRDGLPALLKGLRDDDPAVRRWSIAGIHRLTIYRFAYDPDKSPSRQMGMIRFIEDEMDFDPID
jgi:hypothetical protein